MADKSCVDKYYEIIWGVLKNEKLVRLYYLSACIDFRNYISVKVYLNRNPAVLATVFVMSAGEGYMSSDLLAHPPRRCLQRESSICSENA